MLQLNKSYSGFILEEIKNIKEINSTTYLFKHDKTGARLYYIENDDDNKVFSISFRTTPNDSTGVAHILEHSVLCGSKKFPSKEPFVELVKGSLNTFLNAMTFPDKTMYPVASRNDKDFRNLMDVYLDAVFHPNIYTNPQILMQEGWHYELNDEKDDIELKGVVYNEMKGALSSPESVLFRKMLESLYPDTTYGFESGGDPDVIPNITQEDFLNFHKKYYHPSNSYIFLYGKMDILDQLQFINDEYLNEYSKIQVDSKIKTQPAFESPKELVVDYPISPNENEADKTFLSLNFSISKATNTELTLAFNILEHILLETPSSPLKEALIKKGIGKDVFGVFESEVLQPMFGIVVKNSNESKKSEFEKVVFETLKSLVDNGIDKKLIEATINLKEFNLRESDFKTSPKGLIYSIKCMDSWLYDESPSIHLEYESALNKIKKALTTNYLEDLIEKYLLSNNHRSLLVVRPKKGLLEEKAKETSKELKHFKESLSKEELNKLIETTKALKKRQATPDKIEDLEKLPLLSIDDIEKNIEKYPTEELEIHSIKTLFHDLFTNKISYVNLYFDTTSVPQDLIPYIGLLSSIIGKVSTTNYSYGDLSNEININTGGISYLAFSYTDANNHNKYYPKFCIRSKALVSKLPELFNLLREVILNTKYDDKNRIKEVIMELKSRLEMTMLDRGHLVASSHLLSYFSASGKYDELLLGFEFYKFIEDLEINFDSKSNVILENLSKVSNLIFNKNNLLVGLTCNKDDLTAFENNFKTLLCKLPSNEVKKQEYKFTFGPLNEGLMTSSKVQYVCKAFNFKDLGFKYSGSLRVLKTILSYDYLWNKVRVLGGAYGGFASFQRDGNMFFASYRDPNLTNTLDAYNKAYEYVNSFDANEREMTKYILGTISELDTPLTASLKGQKSDAYYISNTTYDFLQQERNEILSTNTNTIKSFASLIDNCMKKDYLCVMGNESKIKENKDLFNNLINVLK